LISWAIDAASSPIVVSRATRASSACANCRAASSEAVITHGMELLSVSAPPTCSIFQKIHGQIMKPEQPHRPRLDNRGLHRPFRPPGPIDRSEVWRDHADLFRKEDADLL
jgi:hypothetical protein